ncbi:hypothetical protein KP509_10G033500 [Ceratopteris richardii]|uniref:SWIRM domain-containing protein n=1 Tax=Ceratopteris richardii TaxID=49495 RepID=A0A8T2TUT0_CERRI|nr:hypothetical protein KP509_10G033500 [Ceratopteris richardii]
MDSRSDSVAATLETLDGALNTADERGRSMDGRTKRNILDFKGNSMGNSVNVGEARCNSADLTISTDSYTKTGSFTSQTSSYTQETPESNSKRKRKRIGLLTAHGVFEGMGKWDNNSNTVRALRHQVRTMSYDENLMDTMILNQLGTDLSPAKNKKKKPLDLDKNKEKEALVAASIGFPKNFLTEEEIEAGVVQTIGDVEQDNYIEVRNHILARWRENVHLWLDKSQVMESIRSQHKVLVDAAYKFLSAYGYINFGVAPAIKVVIPEEPTKSTVIIIGAGLAGLGAARQLLAFGHKVVVIEGRNRPGGRVYTRKMEGGGERAAADLGGSVITGLHGNPLGVLARQLSLPLHKIREKCPLYQPNGSPLVADVDAKVEAQFNKLLDRASQLREQMGQIAEGISLGQTLETLREDAGVAEVLSERQLFDWHLANLEYANAGLLSDLSLAFWDQDDPYEMGGDHCFLPGGNVRLVSALAEGVPILYGKQVHTIRYSASGVQVVTANQVFEGDMALCTVPLGVLKHNIIKFEPELPQRKLDAIRRLGFGLLNKVAMLFPRVFWGSEVDTFGHLAESSDRRGEFFLFYSYAAVSGGPLLLALIAGEAAINFERMPPTDATQRVLAILRGIFEPKGISVPDPIQAVCTRWGGDPLSFGSYSHVAVGASGDDYDILAESVGDGRLFFAGEATNRRYPATMHGALLSGLREAGNIAAHAANRLVVAKVERAVPKDTQAYAALLADLFREPDLEFGSFAVLFDPRAEEPKSHVLLRVMIGMGTRKKINESGLIDQPAMPQRLLFQQLQMHQQQQLHLYTMINRQQAIDLMEIRGGDKMRLYYLCETLGVKLVGRRGLGAQGDALVAAIKWNRAARRPSSIAPVILNGRSSVKLVKQQALPQENLQLR